MKILVVIDMQNDFIDGALGSKEAQAIVPNVKKKIENYVKNNDYIIYTRDTHLNDYLKTKEGRKLPVPHCIKGTIGWNIPDELMPPSGYEKVAFIDKPSFGYYTFPDMLDYIVLNQSGIREIPRLELVGLCTDICVVSNAMVLKSYFYDIGDISVDASCCAGTTPENHEAALKVMESCQIDVKRG